MPERVTAADLAAVLAFLDWLARRGTSITIRRIERDMHQELVYTGDVALLALAVEYAREGGGDGRA